MLHFLVDASLPRATSTVIAAAGHQALDVRDVGLGAAADTSIADYAKANGLCLITRDGDFGNILDYPPEQYAGIVVLTPPEPASREAVLSLVADFLAETSLLPLLAGRLAVVELGRVRLRPPT
jgi:predicted nuclease of predicted toxin-antitoxin system